MQRARIELQRKVDGARQGRRLPRRFHLAGYGRETVGGCGRDAVVAHLDHARFLRDENTATLVRGEIQSCEANLAQRLGERRAKAARGVDQEDDVRRRLDCRPVARAGTADRRERGFGNRWMLERGGAGDRWRWWRVELLAQGVKRLAKLRELVARGAMKLHESLFEPVR